MSFVNNFDDSLVATGHTWVYITKKQRVILTGLKRNLSPLGPYLDG